MKKIKLFALAAFAMLSTNVMAQAVNFVNGSFKYQTVGTPSTIEPYKVDATITGINGEAASLTGEVAISGTFSQTINGRNYTVTVTGLANSALENALLTKVTLPKELKTIGNDAFKGCTALSSLEIESGSQLTTIGNNAFATTHITKYDFTNCTKLAKFPTGVNAPFVVAAGTANTFVTEVKMPTSVVFTDMGTALANLPNLETTNLKDTKIQSVVANAFAKSAKLTSIELPATVKTIATDAFKDSKVATLTINVDAITTIAPQIYGTVAADQQVPTSITLKGELTGQIQALAFDGLTNVTTVDLSGLTLGTNAKILGTAFNGLTNDGFTSIKIGNITDNSTGGAYTIAAGAFTGCTNLKTVEIGNITANTAIGGAAGTPAFGAALESVTIGNVYSGGLAIQGGAFQFATNKDASIKIGNVRATALTPVFDAAAFTLAAAASAGKSATIEIGAIESAGNTFTVGTFSNAENYTTTGSVSIKFSGAIVSNGLDVKLFADASRLKTVTFEGAIASQGLKDLTTGNGVFNGIMDGATVTFNGELASGAIGAFAFEQTTPATDVLTVNYTATPADPTVIPFKQNTFNNAKLGAAPYPVTINITNLDLAANFRALQDASATSDDSEYFRVAWVQVTKALTVFQKTGTSTSYGRFEMNVANFPNGLTIDRHQGNVTFTLYTTYVEDDATNKIVTINMQPIPSVDGKYRLDPAGLLAAPGEIVIVKATGTTEAETEMKYIDFSGVENPNAQIAGLTAGTEKFAVSANHITNQQLVDGDAAAPFNALFNAGKQVNDIYFLSNPSDGKGIKANAWDIKSSGVYVAIGSYYVVTNYYEKANGAAAARIVWADGSEEATAIQSIKKAVNDGAIYNLAGQKVSASYKGVVIKDGKKYIQK